MLRLTKDVIAQILKDNEGFTKETYYASRNFRESIVYRIKDGVLIARRKGKTSWADSRFDDEEVCDIEQTRRFIKKYLL